MLGRAWENYKKVDPVISLGGNVFSVVVLLGLPVGTLMAYLSSQLGWFWETFQWFGFAFIGLVTWLLVGLGFNLYRREKTVEDRHLDPWLIGAGVSAIALIVCLVGFSLKESPPKSAAAAPENALAAIPDIAPLILPKLGTQLAKEDFQRAINDMSQIVRRAEGLVKMSSELGGNRPLIRMDNDSGGDLVAKLQNLDADWKVVYTAFMDGTGGQFFAKFPPTQKQALSSLMPQKSQEIWETYHRSLIKFTVAVMMIQDAHPKRLENGAQFERARANADFAADDFRTATSPLHVWVQSVTDRMDKMSNAI